MIKTSKYEQPFHLVTVSPWPLLLSISMFGLVITGVNYLHRCGGILALGVMFFWVLWIMQEWFLDVSFEATVEAAHTIADQKALRLGMVLFIVSEVMFFFGFFWAFFHSSLSPTIEIGAVWPPLGIDVLDPWGIPFVNTLLLLLSGVWATMAHHIIKHSVVEYFHLATVALTLASLLGIIFLLCQLYEYITSSFSISDAIYGSVFYLLTGFHGLHVIVGTIFLIVTLVRHKRAAFAYRHYFGIEAAVWYWHFVDVVWLFLFVSLYWWGS
jgi:cytochrome c oxidase subunit 3